MMHTPREVLISAQQDDYKLEVVKEYDGEVVWWMNGIPIMQGQEWDCDQVEFANFQGSNNNILVAGLGHGNTSHSALEFGNVTTVEIMPEVIDYYLTRFPDPCHELYCGDIYDFLQKSGEKYDGILFQLDFLGEGHSYQYCKQSNSRLYTLDFFQIIYNNLHSGGIFVTEGTVRKDEPSPLTAKLKEAGFQVEEEINEWVGHEKGESDEWDYARWRCVRT